MPKKAVIRSLRRDEPVPDFEPRRYRAQRGYIKLRWLIDTQYYVEEYEHRIAAGRPPQWMHVHHINGIKDDNRPENLEVMTPEEHTKRHMAEGGAERQRERLKGKRRGGQTFREAKALRAAKRREEFAGRTAEMKRLYLEGKSTIEIGSIIGIHPSGVSRHLREAGVLVRHRNQTAKAALPKAQQVVKVRAGMRCEKCGASTKWVGAEIHHRLPRGRGGTSDASINSPANLLNLCKPCHAGIESDREEAKASGWLLPRNNPDIDPSKEPLLCFDGWHTLDDHGGRLPYLGEVGA
jgi:DNA-binding CsgD family transcriptional regulator